LVLLYSLNSDQLMSHHSLKIRFQATLTGAILGMSFQEIEILPIAITALIDRNTKEQDGFAYAIAIGLYHHQHPDRLNNYLSDLESLILALVIAYACRDALNPKNLISQICAYLEQLDTETKPTIKQLRLAQTLVEQGQSLAIARSRLDGENIAFGLYCFLSTPDQWELATLRSGKMRVAVGSIAAAYQGQIPLGNRQSIDIGMKIADRLLAAWSGAYDLDRIESDFYPAITAPDLLKRRL